MNGCGLQWVWGAMKDSNVRYCEFVKSEKPQVVIDLSDLSTCLPGKEPVQAGEAHL